MHLHAEGARSATIIVDVKLLSVSIRLAKRWDLKLKHYRDQGSGKGKDIRERDLGEWEGEAY